MLALGRSHPRPLFPTAPFTRNPLLHFPEALYRHAGQDLHLPILLLLNKCDLVHPAAAAQWKAWFEGRHPGLTALPVSAARSSAGETQRAVLAALMGMRVRRRGAAVRVADVVGLGLGEWVVVDAGWEGGRIDGKAWEGERHGCRFDWKGQSFKGRTSYPWHLLVG